MTITDNGRRSIDDLIAQARGLYEGKPLPSKSKMTAELKTHFSRAQAVHDSLSAERAEAKAQRRREARAKLGRKRNGSVPFGRVRLAPAPSVPISPAPAEVVDVPLDEPVAEVDQKAPAPTDPPPSETPRRRAVTWPIFLLALPAFAAVWSGWVGLGGLTGFGLIQPFPGIPVLDGVELDTRITLPIGVETYAAYAMYVWLSGLAPRSARRFAMWSVIGSLVFGAAGQVAFHLMVAAGMTEAPWQITTVVACLPVAVLGMGAALRHLVHAEEVSK